MYCCELCHEPVEDESSLCERCQFDQDQRWIPIAEFMELIRQDKEKVS